MPTMVTFHLRMDLHCFELIIQLFSVKGVKIDYLLDCSVGVQCQQVRNYQESEKICNDKLYCGNREPFLPSNRKTDLFTLSNKSTYYWIVAPLDHRVLYAASNFYHEWNWNSSSMHCIARETTSVWWAWVAHSTSSLECIGLHLLKQMIFLFFSKKWAGIN